MHRASLLFIIHYETAYKERRNSCFSGKERLMRLIKKLLVAIAVCSTPAMAINVGDTAPQFSLSTYGGGTFDLAQQKGTVTVLLFLCYV